MTPLLDPKAPLGLTQVITPLLDYPRTRCPTPVSGETRPRARVQTLRLRVSHLYL